MHICAQVCGDQQSPLGVIQPYVFEAGSLNGAYILATLLGCLARSCLHLPSIGATDEHWTSAIRM